MLRPVGDQQQHTGDQQEDSRNDQRRRCVRDHLFRDDPDDRSRYGRYDQQQGKLPVVGPYHSSVRFQFPAAGIGPRDGRICRKIPEHAQRFHDQPADVPPEHNEDDHQRSQVEQDVEEDRALRVYMKKILRDRQVTGAADRQELRDPLENAQKYRLQ